MVLSSARMPRVPKSELFQAPSDPVRPPGAESSAVRALVIEDEPKVADALRRGLQSEAMDVALAHSVEGALRATQAWANVWVGTNSTARLAKPSDAARRPRLAIMVN